MNTYGYVGGNPVNGVDPLGLVEWTGVMNTISVVPGGGAAKFEFIITSECINNTRATLKIVAGGSALGIGGQAGVSWSKISFDDGFQKINPWAFSGQAKYVSASAAFSLVGIGMSAFQLGEVRIFNGLSWSPGIDLAVIGGVGVSNVDSTSFEACGCSSE